MEAVRQDTGLRSLALLLRFHHQVAVDPAQITYQFAGAPIGIPEIPSPVKPSSEPTGKNYGLAPD
jgi:hypothetical protein